MQSIKNGLLFFCFCGIFLSAFAQSESNFQRKKIDLVEAEIRLTDVLFLVAEKAEFNLSFNPSILEDKTLYELNYKQKSAAYIFHQILPKSILIQDLGNSIILQQKTRESNGKIKLEGKILSSQGFEPIKGALVLEVSALASTFSQENGSFTLEVEAEKFQELHLSISKEGFKDSLIRIDFGEEKVSIQLTALSPAEIEKDISPMPQKGYENFTYSRVLVPKKVQKRTELSPFNFYRAYQFSLFPGISTNQKMSGNVSNNYSFNLVGGFNYGTHTLELGSAFNINRKFSYGWQLAGGFNFVGGIVAGVQLSGGANVVGQQMDGTQLSGGINFVYGNQSGLQGAGGANIVLGESQGLQLAGGFNQATHLKGIQISGGFNAVIQEAEGLQIAPVNYATILKGKQIGIVNVADSADGIPVGLVSFVRKGGLFQVEFSSDELSYGNVALKMGVPKLYNIYAAGMSYHQNDFFWNYGLGLGTEFLNANNRPFNSELLFHWLHKKVKSSFDHYGLVKYQFLMQNKAQHKWRISYGPSLNLLVFENKLTKQVSYEDLPPYSFLNTRASSIRFQAWLGFRLAIGLRDFL